MLFLVITVPHYTRRRRRRRTSLF